MESESETNSYLQNLLSSAVDIMVVLHQRWRQHSAALVALRCCSLCRCAVLCSVQYSSSTEKLLMPPRSGDSLALTHLLDNGLDSDISFRLGGGARWGFSYGHFIKPELYKHLDIMLRRSQQAELLSLTQACSLSRCGAWAHQDGAASPGKVLLYFTFPTSHGRISYIRGVDWKTSV